MKKILTIISILVLSNFSLIKAQIYTAKDGATNISFYSEAPLENIEAVNKSASVVFKSSTADLQMSISIQNFKFKNIVFVF